MGSLTECPNCGREAEKAFSSNFFPVHTCLNCDKKYCDKCDDGGNCPECGSSEYSDNDKVYSE